MKKSLKYIIIAAIVGTGGYLFWKSKQPAKK